MAETTIYVRGTRTDVHRAIAKAAAAASGRNNDAGDAGSAMQVRLGMTALSLIRDAFITKSRGGTDECGLSWQALAKSTVAYSRRHPGVPPGKQRAAFSPSWMLTAKQRKRWWMIYRKLLGTASQGADFHRIRLKGSAYASHAMAARQAWKILKAEGAKTLMSEYGNNKVDILRDTGLLLNSLSPGVETSASTPPTVENQVFRVGQGSVIVGTNRRFAAAHHNGTARIPQRRLWAAPSQWPDVWWEDLADQARAGYIDIVIHLLRNP